MGRFAIPVTMAWSMASLWGCEQMVQVLDMATYSEGIAPTRPKLSFLGPHARLSTPLEFSAPHEKNALLFSRPLSQPRRQPRLPSTHASVGGDDGHTE